MANPAPIIDPLRFAAALPALPLDALHAKAAELQNSLQHLRLSNAQMLPFADAGDQDCKEAMFENLAVMGRMNERVAMIRVEVEGRGMPWPSEEREAGGPGRGSGVGTEAGEQIVVMRGSGNGDLVNGDIGAVANGTGARSGRLTDDELRRQMEARMAENDEEEGVYL